ncbi:MAG: ABC transporter substrate-binding protein [Desulfobacteraceae bacterium]|nr:MAG: ABC transporter substrate-binding protein [Desulfobacteraceae bacterium]
MKKLLSVALGVVFAVLMIVASPAAAADPVKIGVLVPLTGIVAQGGLEMKYGIEMAAEEKGKVLGRPIELLVEDTQIKPPVAVTKAEKLVYKDGCKALIGVFSSGVGLAIAENIDKLNVPFVTTHVMTTEFYNLHPLVFRSGQLANDQTAVGNVKGILARPELKNRTYYVIVHDYAWGHDAGERFIALAKQNGIKIYNEAFDKAPIATKDWSSYISKIKASGADGIYMAFITNVIPVFAKQAADFGLQAKGVKLVSGAAPGPLELEAGGEACYGIFGVSDWSWDVNNAISDKWEKDFFAKYKTIPSDAAVHSYVGAMNLFNAIDKAGSTDAKLIGAALRGISFNGPYGVVRISAKDNCARNDAVLTETMAAPANPFGAKVTMKVLETFKAEDLGPSEK